MNITEHLLNNNHFICIFKIKYWNRKYSASILSGCSVCPPDKKFLEVGEMSKTILVLDSSRIIHFFVLKIRMLTLSYL